MTRRSAAVSAGTSPGGTSRPVSPSRITSPIAPTGVATRFFSLQKTIDVIGKASPRQKIFIVAETPEDVLTLVKGGVPIKKVNIGNMHMSEGKRQVATSVAVNDEDVAAFKELQELGVELEIRRVPSTPVEDTSKLFS